MKKILHITNWYPNRWDDLQGVFIQEQFKVFSEITNTHLINVQVREGKKVIEYKYYKYSKSEEGYYLLTKIKSNKVIELLTTFLLLWVLIKSNYKKYDLLHFHIAYPLLIHHFLWKKIIKIPIIISEHWSAYHFNFYMPKDTKKLDGIKNIFKQNIPLITVSQSLLNDIQNFSKSKDFSSTIIPNVLKKKFKPLDASPNEIPVFFIVNIWRKIKNPFTMIEAFAQLADKNISFILKIGGYGELLEDMKKYVITNQLESNVVFLGKMNNAQIEQELNQSDAYLFTSFYETFSIACAEALVCGNPLIGPPIPSILEYTKSDEIIIIDKDDVQTWENQLEYFLLNRHKYNRKQISTSASNYFSNKKIKKQYLEFIHDID